MTHTKRRSNRQPRERYELKVTITKTITGAIYCKLVQGDVRAMMCLTPKRRMRDGRIVWGDCTFNGGLDDRLGTSRGFRLRHLRAMTVALSRYEKDMEREAGR